MGSMSTAVQDLVLDELFGNGANNVAPTSYYIALSLTTPTNAGDNVTEPAGFGYARVSYTNNVTNWPSATGNLKSSGTLITFPTASGGAWGNVTHWCLYSSATGGTADFRGWGALDTEQTISDGSYVVFGTGALQISSV